MDENKIFKVISDAKSKGLILFIEEGELKIKLSKGTKPDPVALNLLKTHKSDIKSYLLKHISKNISRSKIEAYDYNLIDKVPLSFAQESIWLVDSMKGGSEEYNISQIIQIDGNLEPKSFEIAINILVNRHDVFRTVIKQSQGVPHQVLLPENGWTLNDVIDISKWCEETKNDFIDTEIEKKFDLSRDHTLRIVILKDLDKVNKIICTIHHISFDGWSAKIFKEELFEIYDAVLTERKPNLAYLPIRYSDYSIWQRENLVGDTINHQLDYWKENLAGVPNLNLPLDHIRPVFPTNRGGVYELNIASSSARNLRKLAKKNGATLFITLLAAFNILMRKYSGQEDFAIGVPVANRDQYEVENLIGFFVNSVAIRTDLSSNPSFEEYLKQVRDVVLSAFENQQVPFAQIVREVYKDDERDLSRTPIFQVMFVNGDLQEDEEDEEEDEKEFQKKVEQYGDRVLDVVDTDDYSGETSKYELAFEVSEDDGGLFIGIEFNTDLFDFTTIERITKCYETLLLSILKSPSTKIDDLEIVSSSEKETLLNDFNDTEVEFPREETIVSLFQEQVKKWPENIAVAGISDKLPYKELDDVSNRIANYLISNYDLKKEELIGIRLKRGVGLISSILGILKSGCAYVPIDPDYPQKRIDYIKEDTKCKLIITEDVIGQILSKGLDTSQPNVILRSNQLAYIIYTSGSTGMPKGVMVNHRSVINLCYWHKSVYLQDEYSNATMYAGVAFDASVWEIYPYLLTGGTLYPIIDDEIRFNLNKFGEFIENKKITHSYLPTSVCQDLSSSNLSLENTVVSTGGEALKMGSTSGFNIINNYGPSENTVCATWYPITEPVRSPIPIGKPIANNKILILSENNKLQPIGVVGELCISGESLSMGYFNRPKLTNEKFVDNPFYSNQRMYKTGDLAKWLPDGNLEFVGRKDNQIKLRGFRIEIGEIENTIEACASVDRCVVTLNVQNKDNKVLVAYIVSNSRYNANDLKNALSDQLPPYMVPSIFMELDEIPLTVNGKIDRKALPEIEKIEEKEQYFAPTNETEERLAVIWSEVLGIEKISRHSNFFELGGNSLISMQLISFIRDQFDTDINIKLIFLNSTIAELALALDQLSKSSISKIIKIKRPELIPLSFAQERLWFIDQLEEDSSHYNISESLWLEKDVDIPILERAIRLVLERHEILRTVYYSIDGKPYQKQIDASDWNLELTRDISACGEDEVSTIVEEESNIPFNLSRDFMIRGGIYKCFENEILLLLTIHHIAFDEWSMTILIDEILGFYKQELYGNTYSASHLPIQYSDYSIWQRSHLENMGASFNLDYWVENLNGVIDLNLPLDYSRPVDLGNKGKTLEFSISEQQTSAIKRMAQSQGVTPFMFLLGAFKVLLFRYSGQSDFCIGTVVANREQYEVKDLIGFFVNTLCIKTNLSKDKSFLDYLAIVKTTILNAYEHKDIPFEKVVASLVQSRDTGRSPLFQVMFTMLDEDEDDEANKDSNAREMDTLDTMILEEGESKFELSLGFQESSDQFLFKLEYNIELFKDSSIKRMALNFVELLDGLIREPNVTLNNFSILRTEEEKLILEDFVSSEHYEKSEDTILSVFDSQVIAMPNKPAVIAGDQTLSYLELDKLSNKYANFLLSNYKLEKEDIIAIKLQRGISNVCSILAILKTGCAYLPIDPAYPKARINLLQEDSNAKLIIDNEIINQIKDSNFSSNSPRVEVKPDQLAYIIYTSGSTGIPKGVMIEHRNVINLCKWHTKEYNVNSESRGTLYAGVAFDASVWELFPYILNGAAVYPIVEESFRLELTNLITFFKDNKITHSYLPTAICHSLAEENIEFLNTKILTGGEALKLSSSTNFKVYNNYGPTENTVVTTSYQLNEKRTEDRIPIGRPIHNTQVYILSEELKVQPIGVVGEICISGASLSRGYWNRPELNEKIFVDHPFSVGQKIYKTGDLARWLENGNIEFVGRKDNQIKLRGFRIEIGEIEKTIEVSSSVKRCVVELNVQKRDNKKLVAYVVSNSEFNAIDLKVELSDQLPSYMIPSVFVELDEIPFTLNGKINRKALPKIENLEETEQYVEPVNEIEERLAVIWGKVLGIEKVSRYSNFFELGGNSLISMKLVSSIRKQFDVDINVKLIFINSTIAELAIAVDELFTSSIPQIQKIKRPELVPLSFAQERLWFIDQLEGDSSHYNVSESLLVEEDIDITTLERAICLVIARHEILRTVYYSIGGIPYQKQIDASDWNLENTRDISAYSEDDMSKIIEEESDVPFDLGNDFMIRGKIYKCSGNETLLLLTIHHIAFDEWSMSILIDEILGYYKQEFDGEIYSASHLPIQYSDYSIWQRNLLGNSNASLNLDYWKENLNGVVDLNLPLDYSRPVDLGNKGKTLEFSINKKQTSAIKGMAQSQGVTPFMFLLGAFKVLLFRYSGQSDFCIGTAVANREQYEVKDLIGFFVNTLCIKTNLSKNKSFLDYLENVKATILNAYEHKAIPFEKVVTSVVQSRDTGRSPLFQVVFTMLDGGGDEENDNIINLREVDTLDSMVLEEGESKFELSLGCQESSDKFVFKLEYNIELFKDSSIKRMALNFVELLDGLILDPIEIINRLPILSSAETSKLIYTFNDNVSDFPEEATLVSLFTDKVNGNSDSIAVVYGGQELCYEELDKRSNQLAHYLITQCVVKKGDLVSVVLDRGEWLIVSFLAILKSGGVYVPIDSKYPEERKEYIRRDSCSTITIDSVLLNLFDTVASEYSDKIPKVIITPTDLAYVIYTSGSTGQPKGVMIEHNSIVNTILSQISSFSVTEKDNCLQFASSSFDASIWEIWISLLGGGRLCVLEEKTKSDIDLFKTFIFDHKITFATLPPAFLQLLSIEDLEGVETLITAGESIPLGLAKAFSEKYNYVNAYGPTETSICATTYKGSIDSLVPIGEPIANTQVYILNEDHDLLPIGVVGELCVGGTGVARGYLNREELTAEKFIDNPFTQKGLIYKTGDLARWLSDGTLEFIGRKDDQVKIRGYRIELGEIENVLSLIKGVIQCCVLANEDTFGNKYLVGYIVKEDELDKEKIQDYLKLSLPEYMIPTLWLELETMPVTSNGKIDKKSLPKQDGSILSVIEYVAPIGKTEEDILEIWQDLLKLDGISTNSNFFEIGGHSLLAIRLSSHLKKKFNLTEFPVRLVFENSTIQQLALQLEVTQIVKIHEDVSILKEGGQGVPIVIIPGIFGFIETYHELANNLDENSPVYGIEYRGFNSDVQPLKSIHEIAIYNIELLKKLNLYKEDLRLIGHSFGGIVCIEMMKILNSEFKTNSSAVIIDVEPHMDASDREDLIEGIEVLFEFFIERGYLNLKENHSVPKDVNIDELLAYVPQNKIWHKIETEVISKFELDEKGKLEFKRMYKVFMANMSMDYRTKGFDATQLLIVFAKENKSKIKNELRKGWSRLIGPDSIIESEGNHYTIVSGENAKLLSRRISERWNKRDENIELELLHKK